MTLTRDEVTAGLPAELDVFGDLVRGLDDTALGTPTRCAGWTVRDVAAHVIGTLADITNGRLEGQGTPEVTARQVAERAGRSGAELADELAGVRKVVADLLAAFDDAAWAAPAPAGYDGPLHEGIEALWYDAYLHGDDIRAALGRKSVRPLPSLHVSVQHAADMLAKRGWGPATLTLEGLPEIAIGGGGGRRVEGDPLAFLLAATGRTDPATIGLSADVNIYA